MLNRLCSGILLGVGLCLTGVSSVQAQSKQDFDATHSLLGTHELGEGGQLYSNLFKHGWPTNQAWRELTVETAGKTSNGLVRSYLASEAGLELSASDFQNFRKDEKVKAGDRIANPRVLLAQELRAYQFMSGFKGSTGRFTPIFMPVHRTPAKLVRAWDEEDLTSMRWKAPENKRCTLDGFGFAMLAEVEYAAAQLSHERIETQQGREIKLVGHTERDGFFALLALHSALAKVHALRHTLLLDVKTTPPEISKKDGLAGLSKRRYYFPAEWEGVVENDAITYKAIKGDTGYRSRLGSQAVVLLALCRLSALTKATGNEKVREVMFDERNVEGRKIRFAKPSFHDELVEAAVFSFQSIRTLHVSVEGRGRASTLADPRGRGGTITPRDLSLFLQAIEAFVNHVELDGGRNVRGPKKQLMASLADEQKKARALIRSLAGMILTWHQNQAGFYDRYDVRMGNRAVKSKSLASQGFAIQGLLATHRALARSPKEQTEFLTTAKAAVRWLDDQMWSESARAYVQDQKLRRASLEGAMSVLGAMREMAYATGDGRYLMRYRQYLESLRDDGLIRGASDTAPPSLANEISFSAKSGGDSK